MNNVRMLIPRTVGFIGLCLFFIIMSGTVILAQQKMPVVTQPEEEMEAEEASASQFKEMGGAIGKKIERDNPDIFPAGLSDLERSRRMLFALPRVDQSGKVQPDRTFDAWQQLQETRALQLGTTFSLTEPQSGKNQSSGMNTSSVVPGGANGLQGALTWNCIGPRNANYTGRIGDGAIAAHPAKANIGYVGGSTGGVGKTPD